MVEAAVDLVIVEGEDAEDSGIEAEDAVDLVIEAVEVAVVEADLAAAVVEEEVEPAVVWAVARKSSSNLTDTPESSLPEERKMPWLLGTWPSEIPSMEKRELPSKKKVCLFLALLLSVFDESFFSV